MTRHPLRRGTAQSLLLEYIGSDSERSQRTIMPIAILAAEGPRRPASTYLQARCSVAKATRSFRFDRIQSLSDVTTGEVIPADSWLASLQLGAGQPFTLFDDHQDELEPTEPPVQRARPTRSLVWRAAFYALAGGYLIGRLRLLHLLLHLMGVHQARWL